MNVPNERWFDREAGPIVRPYAMTRGRTMPAADAFIGLIDTVLAEERPQLPIEARLNSEHRRLLRRLAQPVTVVDLASDAGLPVGVVRVLLSDLAQWGAIKVVPVPRGHVVDERILREVLNGLQAI
jgi:hypothetical protein